MTWTQYPQSRSDGILTQQLADEILIYDLDREKVLCLNESTALVWHQCDGTKSVAEISRALSAQTGTTVNEDVVWMALRQLKSENLLAVSDSFETPFDGMTRREMVRRVGLGTLAALPVIFEVVAPSAAHAQSQFCGPIGNCTSGQTTLCVCLPIAQVGSNINPNGCPCATNGDCSGDCQSNVCVGGTQAPICIPGDTSNRNPNCCPCSNVEGCANCCNDGVCGPCIG